MVRGSVLSNFVCIASHQRQRDRLKLSRCSLQPLSGKLYATFSLKASTTSRVPSQVLNVLTSTFLLVDISRLLLSLRNRFSSMRNGREFKHVHLWKSRGWSRWFRRRPWRLLDRVLPHSHGTTTTSVTSQFSQILASSTSDSSIGQWLMVFEQCTSASSRPSSALPPWSDQSSAAPSPSTPRGDGAFT